MKGRQDSIIKYCRERGLELLPANPEAVATYERSIKKLIPEIEADLKESAFRAHYFRLGIDPPPKRARTAPVDTLPKGQDAKQGLAGTEGSAVGEAETPNT